MAKSKKSTKRADADRTDWQQEVTNSILAMLEEGTRPWTRPWSKDGYNGIPMRHNGEHYRGVNIFILDMAAMTKGFNSGYWMTFRQAKELGGCVRKGETSQRIFKAGTFNKTVEIEDEDTGETEKFAQSMKYLKAYAVFNADQIDGLPEHFYMADKAVKQNPDSRRDDVETFFRCLLSDVRHGGGRAFYRPSDDFIQMPPFERFKGASAYYATLAHEHVHWTKAEHRVNRDLGSKGFGSEGYAREELVAELGAALIARYFGFENHDREDHAAYIGSWIKVLKNDKREFFKAAAHAQRAVDWMLDFTGIQTAPTPISEASPELSPEEPARMAA